MSKKNKKAMKQEQKQEVKHEAKAQEVKQQEQPKQEVKQQAAKKEEPKNFIESYTSNTSTCARLIAKALQQGADINTLAEKAKAFNQAAGKGAKCLETPASLKAHFRWLLCKGVQVEESNGVYRLKSA